MPSGLAEGHAGYLIDRYVGSVSASNLDWHNMICTATLFDDNEDPVYTDEALVIPDPRDIPPAEADPDHPEWGLRQQRRIW